MCSLGIEPTTFALLTQCSTTEPQEHFIKYIKKKSVSHFLFPVHNWEWTSSIYRHLGNTSSLYIPERFSWFYVKVQDILQRTYPSGTENLSAWTFPTLTLLKKRTENTEKHEVKMRPECSTTAYKKTFTEGSTTASREQKNKVWVYGVSKIFLLLLFYLAMTH